MKLVNSKLPPPDSIWFRPTRDRFDLFFQEDGHDIKILLNVPLDSRHPPEEEARKIFAGVDDNTIEVRCRIKQFSLDSEKARFTELVEQLYKSEVGKLLSLSELAKISDSNLRKVVSALAEQGRNVFYRLFVSSQIVYEQPKADEDIVIVRAAILSALSHSQVLYIHNESPLFPWAFLYNDDEYNPNNFSTIKPRKFWGFMHEIQEELEATGQRLALDADPEVTTAVDPLVDESGWHEAADHPFAKIRTKDAKDVASLRAALTNFESHCLYFFGHADHANPPVQTTSWLELVKTRLKVSELEETNAPNFKNNPVVAFLNGCNTTPLRSWDTNTVVGFLCIRGKKLCCVASVGPLPAPFAAAFAKVFWERFLIDRLPIGTALRLARGYMLDEWNSPLGLLYSLFGRVDTHVVDTPVVEMQSSNLMSKAG